MSDDLVRLLLRRLANDSLVLRESEVASSLDLLVRLGVLRRAEPASAVACRHCGNSALLPVSFLRDETTGAMHGYVSCSDCGVDEIETVALRRWRIDVAGLLKAIFADAEDFKFSPSIVVPDLLWSLGRANWGERSTEVFFAARCRSSERDSIAEALERRPKTILLLPTELSVTNWARATDNIVLAIGAIVELEDFRFELDVNAIRTNLGGVSFKSVKKSPRRRESRLADIKLLEKALRDHLRAARDYAFSTRDRDGEPKLLPRPSQEDLGKQVDIEPWTVTRCMRDDDAQILRYLWEMADDLDQIMAYRP